MRSIRLRGANNDCRGKSSADSLQHCCRRDDWNDIAGSQTQKRGDFNRGIFVMNRFLLVACIFSFVSSLPLPANASLTLIHWYNQTGAGTDAENYSDPSMRGRFKGEALYKNDNDPCVYDQQNIQEKGGNIVRARTRICNHKQESMRNPVVRFGITIPGDSNKIQSTVAEPACAVKEWAKQGKSAGICP